MPNSIQGVFCPRNNTMRNEKRKSDRQDAFLIVEFKPLQSSSVGAVAITRDLSAEGFSMEAQNFDCQCGDILEFNLKHSSLDLSVSATGEIVWKNHAWYKYMVGVKLLEISEAQKSRLIELMSAVGNAEGEQDFADEDSEDIHETDDEEQSAERPGIEKIDESILNAARMGRNDIPPEAEIEIELTDSERSFVTGDAVSDDSVVKQEAGPSAKGPGQGTLQPDRGKETRLMRKRPYANSHRSDRQVRYGKRKIWLYAPLVMIAAVLLVVALPVMIKKFNGAPDQKAPAILQPAADPATDRKDLPAATAHIPEKNDQALDKFAGPAVRQDITGVESERPVTDIPALRKDKVSSASQEPKKESRPASGSMVTHDIAPKELSDKESERNRETVREAGVKKTESDDMAAEGMERPDDKTAGYIPESRQIVPDTNGEKITITDLIARIDKTLQAMPAEETGKVSSDKVPVQSEKIWKAKPVLRKKEPVKAPATDIYASVAAPVESVKTEQALFSGKNREIQPESGTEDAAGSNLTARLDSTVKTVPPPAGPGKPVEQEAASADLKSEKIETVVNSENNRVPAVQDKEETKKPVVASDTLSVKLAVSQKAKTTGSAGKSDLSAGEQKFPKIALLLNRSKLEKIKQLRAAKSGRASGANVSRGWENIGSIGSGTDLFIKTDSISYPAEHVVQLSMRAFVDNKQFIDLLEIDCLENKLRILGKQKHDNPVLSAYSREWRAVVPESAVIYKSACSRPR